MYTSSVLCNYQPNKKGQTKITTETNCFKGYNIKATTNEDGTVNVETWWNENTTGAWWNGTEHAQGKFNTRKEYLKWLTDKFAEIIGE